MATCSQCGAYNSDDKRDEETGVLECRKCGAPLPIAPPPKKVAAKSTKGKSEKGGKSEKSSSTKDKKGGKDPKGKSKPEKTEKVAKTNGKEKEKNKSTPKKGKKGKAEEIDEEPLPQGPSQEEIDNFDFDSMDRLIATYKKKGHGPNIPMPMMIGGGIIILLLIILVVVLVFL